MCHKQAHLEFPLLTYGHSLGRMDSRRSACRHLHPAQESQATSEASLRSPNNHHRIDAQHAKRVVEDVADILQLTWLVQYEPLELAGRIKVIDVDRGVTDAVAK